MDHFKIGINKFFSFNEYLHRRFFDIFDEMVKIYEQYGKY